MYAVYFWRRDGHIPPQFMQKFVDSLAAENFCKLVCMKNFKGQMSYFDDEDEIPMELDLG